MIPTTKLKKLRAFHGDAQLKKDLLSEIVKHQKQDQIIKGTYGVEGSCTCDDNNKGVQ